MKLGEVFMDETQLHRRCDEEYSQLKDEFERYKLRAQSVLKNKNSKVSLIKYTNVKDTNVKDTNVKDTNVKDTNVRTME